MKNFENPELKLLIFTVEDVITTSTGNGDISREEDEMPFVPLP